MPEGVFSYRCIDPIVSGSPHSFYEYHPPPRPTVVDSLYSSVARRFVLPVVLLGARYVPLISSFICIISVTLDSNSDNPLPQ